MFNQRERRALALLLWLPVLGWLVSTSSVLSLPHSAWRSATDPLVVEDMRRVLPQGWAFFTRDPQEPQTHVYVRSEDGWESVPHPAPNAVRSLFGLNRGARLYDHEVGLVMADVPPTAWVDCGEVNHLQCLNSLQPVPDLVVENPFEPAHLCGTLGLLQQEPIPWAWRDEAERIEMPVVGVVVEVSCVSQ
jgi:antimicrobial peptide system SdpA family protein